MKKYILWVTKNDNEGNYSHWYGWSRNLIFTYDEALKEKEKIVGKFYDVELKEI